MIRKTISVTMVFLGTFGVFYSANTGDYGMMSGWLFFIMPTSFPSIAG